MANAQCFVGFQIHAVSSAATAHAGRSVNGAADEATPLKARARLPDTRPAGFPAPAALSVALSPDLPKRAHKFRTAVVVRFMQRQRYSPALF